MGRDHLLSYGRNCIRENVINGMCGADAEVSVEQYTLDLHRRLERYAKGSAASRVAHGLVSR